MGKFAQWLLVSCVLLMLPQTLWAAGEKAGNQGNGGQRLKVGLVLGGGGAAGIAHVGVLKVLEEQGIPIDVIAGTSMGAIIGSLYAAGYKADDLEKIVKTLDWPALFQDGQPRNLQSFQQKHENTGFFNTFEVGFKDKALKLPDGLVSGQKLMFELRRLLDGVSQIDDFDRLPIPFRAVATDIETGEAVVLGKGNLATAVRASMSIPGLFTPVSIGDRLLVDGFVSNNIPVDVARKMGADIVIVVGIPYRFEKRETLNSALAVSLQSMRLLVAQNSMPQLQGLKSPDVAIIPELKKIGSLAFDQALETIPIGEAAARKQLAALRKIAALAPAPVSHPVPAIQGGQPTPATVAAITPTGRIAQVILKNESRLADSVILSKLGMAAGDRLDTVALQRGLDRVHSLGYFDLVDFSLEKTATGDYNLHIRAYQRSTGNNRLRFGFTLEDNFEGDSGYQFGVRHTYKGINAWGGEWHNSLVIGNRQHLASGLRQPLGVAQNSFINADVWHDRQDLSFHDGQDKLVEARVAETGVSAGWGRDVSQNSGLQARLAYRHLGTKIKVGLIDAEEETTDVAEMQFNYSVDTLDDADFPKRGHWLNVDYKRGFKLLGTDLEYDRLQMAAGVVSTHGRHQMTLKGELGSTFDDYTNYIGYLTLGGVGRLSGLNRDQLRGSHVAFVGGTYMYELTDFSKIAKLYAGGSLEFGNTWEERSEIGWGSLLRAGSLFVGMDSRIGPAFVGVGQTEGYDPTVFMQIGRRF